MICPTYPSMSAAWKLLRVGALGGAGHRDLREEVAVLGDVHRGREIDVLRHRHREVRGVLLVVDALVHGGGVDAEERAEVLLEGRPLGRRQLLAVHGERGDGDGLRQHVALGVVDRAADRGDLHEPVAVLLRGHRQLLAPRDLQEPQTGEQAAEQGHHDDADHHEPAPAVRLRHRAPLPSATGTQSRRRRPAASVTLAPARPTGNRRDGPPGGRSGTRRSRSPRRRSRR